MKLEKWRKSKSWSQHELAAQLKKAWKPKKVYQSHVAAWENKTQPRYTTMVKLAEFTEGHVLPGDWK